MVVGSNSVAVTNPSCPDQGHAERGVCVCVCVCVWGGGGGGGP